MTSWHKVPQTTKIDISKPSNMMSCDIIDILQY